MPSPSWTVAGPDGVEIGVHELGSGPDVLLVHGTACDHRVWARLGRRLAPAFTLHALDRRGRGASGDGPAWSLELEARDVAAAARELGPGTPVVGHSLGGILALEAGPVLEDPGPVVAYEPPIHGDDRPPLEAADELARLHREEGPGAAVRRFLREVGYDEKQLDLLQGFEELWEETVATAHTLPRETRADLEYEIDPDRMRGLEAPVLLLEGAESPPDFAPAIRRLTELLPDAERDEVEGASHAVLHEAPGRFAERVRAFLDARA